MYLYGGGNTSYIRSNSMGHGGCTINWIKWEFAEEQMTTRTAPSLGFSDQSSKLSIYPNSVQDRFTFKLNNRHQGILRVQVLNGSGIIQKEFRITKLTDTFTSSLLYQDSQVENTLLSYKGSTGEKPERS